MPKQPKTDTTKSKPELEPRRFPTQKRSQETVEKLLKVSSELLDEVGFDRFNTNLLAERAGVRVATIYRYFPNKLSILSALVDEWFNVVRENLSFWEEIADPTRDWRDIFTENLDLYIELIQSHTGATAIRRALQAVPELREKELSFIRGLGIITVKGMKTRGVKAREDKLFTVSVVFMMSASSCFDLVWMAANDNKALADNIIEEVKLNTISHFANYLE